MKNVILLFALLFGGFSAVEAQDAMKDKMAKTIALEQTIGEFTQKQITVSEGIYVFDISNNGVGHDVGFVLVKKGLDINKPENHIKTAYVTQPVQTGTSQTSKPTLLEKGEYVYFCPLNPTSSDNTLLVQ